MQTGQIKFNPNPITNPTAIGNNWNHLKQQELANQENNEEVVDQEEKLDQLVQSYSQFSYTIRTHFPFDPFPNELQIDVHKVSVLNKSMLSKDALSIPINDINKVEVSNDLLFASIEIVNGSQTTTLSLRWLRKDEAREAQAILQGLMVAYKNNIDISQFDPTEITEKLKVIGAPAY